MTLVAELSEALDIAQPEGGAATLDHPRAYAALRRALRAVHPMTTTVEVALDVILESIDRDLSTVIDAVLHHPSFLRFEEMWRGLKLIVDRVDFRENTKLEILNCSKEDLLADFEDSPDVPKSGLYKIVYSGEYGPRGGRAYGAIVAHYAFGPGPQDVVLLSKCAEAASYASLPFFTGLQHRVEHYPDTSGPQFTKWNAFRDRLDSRYVGVTNQRIAVRRPHDQTWRSSGVRYVEGDPRPVDRPWATGALVPAILAARSFAKWRLACDLEGAVEGLELDVEPSADLSTRLEAHAAMELAPSPEGVRLATMRSCMALTAMPPAAIAEGGDRRAQLEANRSMSGALGISRLVQLCKTVHREQIGAWRERVDIERGLTDLMQRWIGGPLLKAQVRVDEVPGNKGYFRFVLQVMTGWTKEPVTLTVFDNKLDKE